MITRLNIYCGLSGAPKTKSYIRAVVATDL